MIRMGHRHINIWWRLLLVSVKPECSKGAAVVCAICQCADLQMHVWLYRVLWQPAKAIVADTVFNAGSCVCAECALRLGLMVGYTQSAIGPYATPDL